MKTFYSTIYTKTGAATAILAAIALSACNPATLSDGQSDAIDGKGTVTFDISASKSARMLTRAVVSDIPVTDAAGSAVGAISLSAAWVVIKEIELQHEGDGEHGVDDANQVEYVGPFAVDLLTGDSFPPFPQVSIDTGNYVDVEFSIEKLEDEDLIGLGDLPTEITSSLLNYSVYLEGTYSSADQVTYVSIPFSLSNDQSQEFELSGSQSSKGFVVDDTGINDILVAFRLNEWFRFNDIETNSDSIDFETAVSSGAIVLDSNTNSSVMAVIEDNMKSSAEYGEDDDDNGQLDDDEDDDEFENENEHEND